MKNIGFFDYLNYFKSCCNIRTNSNSFEINNPENFYKYISIYSNNNVIECPLIFSIDDCILEKNPILKLIDFNDFTRNRYYKTLSKNLKDFFFDRYTNDDIFSYVTSYSKIVKYINKENNKYLFTKGIIFDSDYNIMCLVTRVHYKTNEDDVYNITNYYFKIYINPKCYEIKDDVCKWIINEFYKNLILYINRFDKQKYNEHFEIEIKDPTDKFIIYPNEIIDPYHLEDANNGDFINQHIDIEKLSDYIVNYDHK